MEKQIEEMARTMCKSYGGCNRCMFFQSCDVKSFAMRMYDAGYRKQSEGEWLYTDICAEDMYCSVCGGIAPVDCEKEEFYKSNYCPNCGARMKGENHGKR